MVWCWCFHEREGSEVGCKLFMHPKPKVQVDDELVGLASSIYTWPEFTIVKSTKECLPRTQTTSWQGSYGPYGRRLGAKAACGSTSGFRVLGQFCGSRSLEFTRRGCMRPSRPSWFATINRPFGCASLASIHFLSLSLLTNLCERFVGFSSSHSLFLCLSFSSSLYFFLKLKE